MSGSLFNCSDQLSFIDWLGEKVDVAIVLLAGD